MTKTFQRIFLLLISLFIVYSSPSRAYVIGDEVIINGEYVVVSAGVEYTRTTSFENQIYEDPVFGVDYIILNASETVSVDISENSPEISFSVSRFMEFVGGILDGLSAEFVCTTLVNSGLLDGCITPAASFENHVAIQSLDWGGVDIITGYSVVEVPDMDYLIDKTSDTSLYMEMYYPSYSALVSDDWGWCDGCTETRTLSINLNEVPVPTPLALMSIGFLGLFLMRCNKTA